MIKVVQKDWIERRIYFLREMKVMLSTDLAELYQVPPKVLIQAIKRNVERFPDDFMFQLNNQELMNLKSQFVTSSWGGLRKPPYAFTEQGIAMLSGVLRSPQAIQMNIEIMRAFVNLRKYIVNYKDLSNKLNRLEQKYDHQFKVVFDEIRKIANPSTPRQRKIGFHSDENE
jgi:ORF6N domain